MQRKGSKRHLTIKIKNETSLNISKNSHYANAIAFKNIHFKPIIEFQQTKQKNTL